MKAIYLDGNSSKRRNCKIELYGQSIKIWYENDNLELTPVEWEVDKILKINVKATHNSLRYDGFPHQVLKFQSREDFELILARYPTAPFQQSMYNRFTQLGLKGILGAGVGVILVSLLFFFYGAPLVAETFARNIPKDWEAYIGEQFKYTYLEYLEVDEVKSKQVQAFYDQLEYESAYDIQITVVESNIANAFALPGGNIVVFSGILDMIESEEELAGLLAHEASHINGRHSLRLISRDLSIYLLLASLTGDIGGFSSVLIENSNLISSLSFSRAFEKEADLDGLNLMVNSQIDPNGMVSLFQKFKDQEVGLDSLAAMARKEFTTDTLNLNMTQDTGMSYWDELKYSGLTELLSTHPTPDNRIGYLNDRIEKTSFTITHNKNLAQLFNEVKN